MFDNAEIAHEVDKATYKKKEPALRQSLLDAQYELLRQRRFPVLILIGGVEGAGKGETVNLLAEWMDPRHLITHAFGVPSDEELERPYMWRFWRQLPPKGKVGIFFGAWHTQPIVDRAMGKSRKSGLDARISEVKRFEKMLTDI